MYRCSPAEVIGPNKTFGSRLCMILCDTTTQVFSRTVTPRAHTSHFSISRHSSETSRCAGSRLLLLWNNFFARSRGMRNICALGAYAVTLNHPCYSSSTDSLFGDRILCCNFITTTASSVCPRIWHFFEANRMYARPAHN